MATVTLRIVGLFFNETFEMELTNTTTVRDVVDACIALHPGLSYTPEIARPSPFSFTNILNGKYNYGKGARKNDSGKSLGNNKVKAGTFTLAEMESEHFDLAWQYYVVSNRGKVKSKTPPTRKFTTWDATPDYRITANDTIIWRLVAIANATIYP